MKKLFILTLTLALFYAVDPPTIAQEPPTQQPSAEEQEKEKAEREKNAYRLLDQLIDEAQSLRLTENRVRVQINAADMLWDRNQGRARSLFQMAAEGVADLGRNPQPTSNRRNEGANQERRAFQLRQELVLAAARHDAQLAYQLLASTKPPAPVVQTTNADQRNRRPPANTEENLEQMLLGRIAALDPKLAAQNAEQMMEKGQFPRTLSEVINQLHKQDPEAAAKLADRTVKRIQGANLLTNNEATALAQSLLGGGIRPPANPSASNGTSPAEPAPANRRPAVLEQSAYVDLLSAVIEAALKATPNSQRTPTLQRTRTPAGPVPVARPAQGMAPPENQNEQNNARRLLAGLQQVLPNIDQYLPAKAASVRQKLSEMGISSPGTPSAIAFGDNNVTADSLVQAATNAPPQMQPRLYQQAAFRALEEGNTDRARQIATNNLPANMRDSVMRYIDFRELAKKGDTARFEEIRQMLGRLQTDSERINLLLQLAGETHKTNPKLALQMLDEAKQMTSRRAGSYEQFEQQLRVARAFSTLDPARSFEVLDPGISQLNELLAAAAVLNGFEINMFRDGELTMQGGGGLTSTIQRFGQELATLAQNDFERAETLAGRFQTMEPRIIAKLAIVQGVLNPRPQQSGPNINPMRGLGQNVNIVRP